MYYGSARLTMYSCVLVRRECASEIEGEECESRCLLMERRL